MFKILEANKLTPTIIQMIVEAPRVAGHCLPGQFLIIRVNSDGERIPLTICDYDREAGTVEIVVQAIGAETMKLMELKAGDELADVVGPLGNASELCDTDIEELKKKKIVFIAGGVGTAPVYPQAKWLHEHGVDCDVIIGAKNKDLVILEDEFKAEAYSIAALNIRKYVICILQQMMDHMAEAVWLQNAYRILLMRDTAMIYV